MENTGQVTFPSTYDLGFLKEQSGIVDDFGFTSTDKGTVWHILGSDFPAARAAVDAYPVAYAPEMRTRMKAMVSASRDHKIAGFTFGGVTIPLDHKTITMLLGLKVGLPDNTDIEDVYWSHGDDQWQIMPRDIAMTIGNAAFVFYQNAFKAHYLINRQLDEADDIHELESIRIDDNEAWPE